MSVGDKAKDFVQKAAGHAEEFVGKKTDDDELKHQGQKDQVMGEARKKTEDVKDELGK
ncbi:CsbD family protein [Frondihabitans cladoniiphilus]